MTEERNKKYEMEPENFRLFYQIQYDRIDKLETKRENFCNYVLTISSAIILISLSTENRVLSSINFLIALVIIANLGAIIFISKTRPFINMHQDRADLASKTNEKAFNKIKNKIGKADSDKDLFRRSRIYSYLHTAVIITMLIYLAIENKWFC